MSTETEIQIPAGYVRPRGEELSTLQTDAAADDAEANFQLGNYYLFNKDVRNFEAAREHYEAAADNNGHAKALCNLANMYYHGRGVTQDPNQAYECFSKAADQGLAVAQYNLAFMYYHGFGVRPDLSKAAELLLKSKLHGATALEFMQDLYADLTQELSDQAGIHDAFTNAAAGTNAAKKLDLKKQLLKLINKHTPAASEPGAKSSTLTADQ